MREFQNDFKLPAALAYAPWKAIEILRHCILLLTSVEFAVYSFFCYRLYKHSPIQSLMM